MVKVEFALLHYLEDEDFRVLVALEMALRNHEVAPVVLIERIARLPRGGARRRLQQLLKMKIIHHESRNFDGYAMKYCAYDFLACHTFAKRGTVTGVGSRVGCGKESDIMTVRDENGNEAIMKLQRLGRCSFRTVALNRDYKNGKARRGASWFYLSRLAASKEYAFMKLLYDEGFPVPKPIDHNRHAVVMEAVNGTLLNSIMAIDKAQKVYERCLDLIVKLAQHGLVHGDFNEFNLFVTDEYRVVMIDFPQMVSTDHKNAAELFARDVDNLASFFVRRHRIEKTFFPKLATDVERTARLDQKVIISGAFTKQQMRDLDRMMQTAEEEEEGEEGMEEEEEEPTEEATAEVVAEVMALREEARAEAADGGAEAEVEEAPPVAVPAPAHPAIAGGDAEDTDSVAGRASVRTSASTASTVRRLLQQRASDNANLTGDGTVNGAHIQDRVKRAAAARGNHEFNLGLHRNVMKGKQKRRVKDEIRNAKSEDGVW